MAAEERRRVAEGLREREKDLASAQAEQDAIKQKLMALEKKIIVGGENLLDKAEEQEKLLEESARELEETIETEQKLRCRHGHLHLHCHLHLKCHRHL